MVDTEEISKLKDNQLMDRMVDASERLRYILAIQRPVFGVAGNIGFGKSFVTRLLRNYGVVSHHERTDDPMLHMYYDDRRAYAEIFQVYLARTRAGQFWSGTKLKGQGYASCVDRSAYEEPLAFIPALNKMGDLTEQQVVSLRRFFDLQFKEGLEARRRYLNYRNDDTTPAEVRSRELAAISNIGTPPPDVMILLHGAREIAWQRVQERAAEYEVKHGGDKSKGLPEDLHVALHEQYDSFERNLRASGWYDGPVITLDQGGVNVVQRAGELILLESIIEVLERQILEREVYRKRD